MSGRAEWIREYYGVPAYRGDRVSVDGQLGVITAFKDGKIRVRFDGLRYSLPVHPTWRVRYLDREEPT